MLYRAWRLDGAARGLGRVQSLSELLRFWDMALASGNGRSIEGRRYLE